MAEELNLGQDSTDDQDNAPQGKGGMMKIIIIAVAMLAIGGGAVFFFMGGEDAQPEGVAEEAQEEEVVEEELDPIYFPLAPAFVVNFEVGSKVRYVQMELQIMSYHQEAIDKVEVNMPAVRNSLIMLFGSQEFENLKTVEGKEKLRMDVKSKIHEVVRLKGDKKINDVFFTAFVMQ